MAWKSRICNNCGELGYTRTLRGAICNDCNPKQVEELIKNKPVEKPKTDM